MPESHQPHQPQDRHDHAGHAAEKPHFAGAFWAWRFSRFPRRLAAWRSGEPMDRLIRELNLRGDEKVLDVGCGAGYYAMRVAARLPGGLVTGLDPAPDFIARLQSDALRRFGNGRVRPLIGSAQSIPLADASQDAVYSVAALHHVPDPRAALAEMTRVLKPGGRLILLDWRQNPRHKGHGEEPRVGKHGHRHAPFGPLDMENLQRLAGLRQAFVESNKRWVYGFGIKPED